MSMSMRMMRGWLRGAMLLVFVMGPLSAGAGTPDNVHTEYERRVAQLRPDDVAEHYELALWCERQEAWELVRKQCTLILAQNGEHAQAKLLLRLALRHLGEPESGAADASEPETPAAGEKAGGLGRIISDNEVYRIRWMEMLEDEPRPLAIRFNNKVIQRFLAVMEGTAEFTTRRERQVFMRRTPMEKARLIKEHTEDRFSEDIMIRTDPKRMADFERHVLPVVLAGCATARCHGNPRVSRFTIYTDRVMSDNKTYTNFLIMHDYRVGNKRLVNRDTPEKSLLLTYGLLELQAGLDPTYKHPKIEIDPIYRGAEDPKYRAVHDWLESLSALEPDYGIALEPSGSRP